MTVAPIIKKIPGKPVKFQHEKDGFVDLSLISKIELLDLFERENKLLNNKKFIDKLPDKGEKIKKFCSKVEEELKRRNARDELCNLFSNLDVNESKEALNKLEWTGDSDLQAQHKLNCDTESETDPLKIIATHSGTNASKEKILRNEEPAQLIKPSDVTDSNNIDLDVDLYAKQLCNRIDQHRDAEKKKFLPYKTLNKTFTRITYSDKEPESSSAYVPKSISGQTKLISLEESIITHQEQVKHLKEVELRHAMERFMEKPKIKMKQPISLVNYYREPRNEDSDDEESYVTEESSEGENDRDEVSNLSDVD